MKPIGISSLLRPCDGFAGGQRHGCGRLAHLQQLHAANVHSCSRSSCQQASQAITRYVQDQFAIQQCCIACCLLDVYQLAAFSVLIQVWMRTISWQLAAFSLLIQA